MSEIFPYDVISKKDGYEIRRYHKQFLAQRTYDVPKDADLLSKTSTDFFPLFNYISGNNNTKTKIAITVPVIMQETENDSTVKRTISFITSMSTKKKCREKKELQEAAHRGGIELPPNKSDILYFSHNSPFTIPYFRKNGICIPVINQQ